MNMDDVFDQMAIRIPAGDSVQYFYGDNISGYFEGWTYRMERGPGYLVRDRSIFRDFTSRCGSRVNRREEAVGAVIRPWGVTHDHDDGRSETFSLLMHRRAVALRVASARPQVLSVYPILDLPEERTAIRCGRNAVVIYDASASEYVAVTASVPFSFEGWQRHPGRMKPKFRTKGQERELVLYLAFGRDEKTALALARELAERDGLEQHRRAVHDILTRSFLETGDPDYDRAVLWSKLSSYFMVVEEFGKGIWAGLPWFRDNWGRDTFIALPGTLLVTGLFDEAREVIRNFFRYQNRDPKSKDYGRVPNRVASATDIIYNTTDGTPWLVREVYEYLSYTGDLDFAREVYPAVKLALDGPIRHYVDKDGFLTHEDADTWMDAKIEGKLPWSARGNRANDIQALWFTALQAGVRLAEYTGDASSARTWSNIADRLKKAFPALFWNPRKKLLADRVTADGRADYKIRPNQLMVLSVPMIDPLLTEAQGRAVVTNAAGTLLYPHGIASLSQDDPYFHPYHHNDAWHHFDAAYHNGTVWGWNAGFATTALCRHGQTDLAWKLARNLSAQILHDGCRGAMSELVEAIPGPDGRIKLSGTWAQAWSSSEFVRNAYQDFGGFNPRLLDGELRFSPHIPKEWDHFMARYPFGRDGTAHLTFKRHSGRLTFVLKVEGWSGPLAVVMDIIAFDRRYTLRCAVEIDASCTLTIDRRRGAAVVEKGNTSCVMAQGVKVAPVKPLSFVRPSLRARPRSIREKDFLQKIVEAGQYR